jgi:hypothetical protein
MRLFYSGADNGAGFTATDGDKSKLTGITTGLYEGDLRAIGREHPTVTAIGFGRNPR